MLLLPHLRDVLVRPRDHVDADDLADPTGGLGAGVDRGAHGGDVAAQGDRDQAAADLALVDEPHVGGLEGRVARLDGGDDAARLDQSDRLTVCHDFAPDVPDDCLQFSCSASTVCIATTSSSFAGITHTSAPDSTLLILASSPRTVFLFASSSMPAQSRRAQTAARVEGEFSPMPPVNTSASQPPSATR